MHPDTDVRDTTLKAQYEAYPYPERNAQDEKSRLLIGSPSHLREIDYWVFGGMRAATRPLRALVAGCGTGDGAIMLATHMARAARPGEVICVDRSSAALAIAKARAEIRQLENIRFIEGSLTELGALDLGQFDYIDCCGVLHHLPDPLAALRGLEHLLAPDGGMGLMVYAPHGRTGVYMLQEALEILAPVDEPARDRLDTAKRVMQSLPATAWLRANGNFGDHLSGGDAGLYDLLLNPRDRAYTISDFLRLIDDAGLEPACLMEPARYDPSLFVRHHQLKARMDALPWAKKAAVAESLAGNMATHVAYVVRKGALPNRLDCCDPATIPVMREIPGAELARHIHLDGTLPFLFGTLEVPIRLPKETKTVLPLIDGERNVGDIAALMDAKGLPKGKFFRLWREIFTTLESLNRVLLRGSSA